MNRRRLMLQISIGVKLLLSTITISANAGTLRVGYFVFPPHTMRENGKNIGATIDYFKLISKEMKLQDVSFEPFPNSRLLNKLETGEIDVGLVFAKNSERAAKFKYPIKPFATMVMAVAMKKSHTLEMVRSVDDLSTSTIGYLKNAYLPDILKDQGIKFDFLTGENFTKQNILKVKRGRIDAVLSDYYSLVYEAKRYNLIQDLKFYKIPGVEVPLYTVMSNNSAKKYLRSYEAALEIVQKKITYQQVFDDFIDK